MEHLLDEWRDHHREVHAERRHQADGQDRQEHEPRPAHVAEALGEVPERSAHRGRTLDARTCVQVRLAHRQQGDDHGQVRDRVDEEGRADAERTDRDAGHRRPDDTRAVEHRRVERDRVAHVLAPDHLDRE